MTSNREEQTQLDASNLCKACGLCCTGHLFAWAKLKSTEVKTAAELGLRVLGSEPTQRGFNQPCPLWEGECTIYSSSHYPHFCRLYKCALLKKLMDDRVSLPEALTVVEQTKVRITELETILPAAADHNFRERLVQELEHGNPGTHFRRKAHQLLLDYRDHFGVKDLIEQTDEATDSE